MLDGRLAGLIELQLRAGMRGGSRVGHHGGFAVFLRGRPHLYYRHRAVPTRERAAQPRSILAMRGIFAGMALQPKVEHLVERWPHLGRALVSGGFGEEQEARVSVAEPTLGGVTGPARPVADAQLADFIAGTTNMFDLGSLASAPVPGQAALRREIARGNLDCVVVQADHRVVAGAALLGRGRIAELAGLWTLEEERGRGYATMVCRLLMDRHRRRGGGLVWLASAQALALGFYRRLGFVPVATHLVHAAPLQLDSVAVPIPYPRPRGELSRPACGHVK